MQHELLMKNTLNKKSQVAHTLTWFVAFIIIVFIMGIFLAGAAWSSRTNSFDDTKFFYSVTDENVKPYDKIYTQRILIDFLNSETEFENQKVVVKDLFANLFYIQGEADFVLLNDNINIAIRQAFENFLDELGVDLSCGVLTWNAPGEGIRFAESRYGGEQIIGRRISLEGLDSVTWEYFLNENFLIPLDDERFELNVNLFLSECNLS